MSAPRVTSPSFAESPIPEPPIIDPHGDAVVEPAERTVSPARELWRAMRSNRGAMLGLVVIVLLVLTAVFADWIAPYGPAEQFREHFQTPPAWMEGGTWQFILGTDDVGRDLLSRLIHGARLSLFIGSLVVTVSLALGIFFGLIAGFFRGVPDIGLMRLMDIVLSMPSLLLAIVIVAILGPGLLNAMIAIAITYVPHYARLTRAAVLSELNKDYVTASRVAGAGTPRLMFHTVLPNCMAPLIVQATLSFSTAILDAAALGFLGLGAQAPTPEWGTMLADARKYLESAPWIVTLPGLAILITVLAFNLMGDGLRDALDPKLKH
jgi:dipeptide transport system permease protein